MDFASGNSGNSLRRAVIKTGPGCQQEGVYCQLLGPEVAPEIYAIIPDGYVMEALQQIKGDAFQLIQIEELLRTKVWSRPALPVSTDYSWKDKLGEFGITVPEHAIVSEPCLVHGDPTVSNALVRVRRSVDLIMCDPRPPRDFIPQYRETDMGRILQSYLGWEQAAYGWAKARYYEPLFMTDKSLRAAAYFWCGAAAARIEFLERSRANRRHILDWCLEVRGICNV